MFCRKRAKALLPKGHDTEKQLPLQAKCLHQWHLQAQINLSQSTGSPLTRLQPCDYASSHCHDVLESVLNDNVLEWFRAAWKGWHNHSCVLLCQNGATMEGDGKPVSSTTYTSGVWGVGGVCPLPAPTQIPWPALPERGRRGILKSMRVENEGVI